MSRPYILSQGAAADLREITRYGLSNWCEAQCRSYIAGLEAAAKAVAKGEGVVKDLGFMLPGLRLARCVKHCIFCMPQAGAPPIIVPILHEGMDILGRLKSRLDP